MPMRTITFCLSVALLVVSPLQARMPSHVVLKRGDQTTLHLGQIAVLKIPSNREYRITLEGDSVLLLEGARQGKGRYLYRAVRSGTSTFIIVPADLKDGDCVSCVTRHCFVRIIP